MFKSTFSVKVRGVFLGSLWEVSCPDPQDDRLVFHLRIDVGQSPPTVFISDIYSVFWKVLLVVRVKIVWK